MGRYEKEYAIYKGDKFLAIGTSKELALFMGVTIETFYYYKSKNYQRRCLGDNHYVVVNLGTKEEK